jgi:hypothetical protein
MGSPITNYTTVIRGIASGDLNGDGKKDLVVGNSYGDSLTILLGNGSGQFSKAPGPQVFSKNGPIYNSIADFNGDLIPDIATANYNGGNISIKLGTGTGSFVPAPSSTIATGSFPYCIDTKDFNSDGKIDIVTVSAGANKAYVFLGTGTGSFVAAAGSPYNTGSSPYHVSVGNFNSDAFPDFAVANGNSNNVSIFLGSGTGSFSAAAGSPILVGTQPRTISLKDLNNDTYTDMVISNLGSNNITVLLGNGTGSFSPAAGSPFNSIGTAPYQSIVADFDLDGKTDIAVTNSSSNYISVWLGTGTGSFVSASGSPLIYGTTPQAICSDDFNGDGKADLAIGDYTSNKLTILINGTLSQQGIKDYKLSDDLSIYPNPANSYFIVNNKNFKETFDFILYDVLGQEVKRISLTSAKVKIEKQNLSNGLYFYKVIDKGNVQASGKIIFE